MWVAAAKTTTTASEDADGRTTTRDVERDRANERDTRGDVEMNNAMSNDANANGDGGGRGRGRGRRADAGRGRGRENGSKALGTPSGKAKDLEGLIARVEAADVCDVERVLREADFKPGPPAYTSVIKACGKASQWQKALEAYRLMTAVHGARPNTITCSALINTLGKSKQCDKAFEIFDEMRERDIPANIFTYSALVSACAKAKRYERAMQVFADLVDNHPEIEVDQITYSAAISACVQGRRADKAIEIFNLMTANGVQGSTLTFNAVLNACEKCADGARAIDTFNRMRSENVSFDRATFSALIGALDRAEEYEKALEYYQSMRTYGVTPDAATVSSVLSVCSNARGAIMASKIYKEAKNKYDITPTPGMFNALISALHRGRRYDMVYEQMYDNMTHSALSVQTYVYLMQACERYGNWDQALVLFEEFRKHSPMNVDAHVWMRAFYACGRFENDDPVWKSGMIPGYIAPSLERARTLLHKMWNDFVTMQRAARASKKADTDALERVFRDTEKMNDAGEQSAAPSSVTDTEEEKLLNTYRSAAAAAARCADQEIAESVLALTKEEELPLDSVIFGALVAALALSGDRVAADAKKNEMVSLGLQPGVATYAAMARASARAGDANTALALAEEVSRITGNQLGDGAIIDAVVAACEAGGDWSRGAALFALWAKNGIPGAHEELQRAMAANAGMDPGPTRSMAYARDMSVPASYAPPAFNNSGSFSNGDDGVPKRTTKLKASVEPFVPRSASSKPSSPTSAAAAVDEGVALSVEAREFTPRPEATSTKDDE